MLVWAPCAFLWLFSLFDLYYLHASLDRNIPWNIINKTKLALNLSLLVLTAVDLIMALVKQGGDQAHLIYPVDLWTPIIKFATFVCMMCVCWMCDFNFFCIILAAGILFLNTQPQVRCSNVWLPIFVLAFIGRLLVVPLSNRSQSQTAAWCACSCWRGCLLGWI